MFHVTCLPHSGLLKEGRSGHTGVGGTSCVTGWCMRFEAAVKFPEARHPQDRVRWYQSRSCQGLRFLVCQRKLLIQLSLLCF